MNHPKTRLERVFYCPEVAVINVSVKADIDALRRDFGRLADSHAPISRAINKTMTTVRARTSRAIRDAGYNIPAGEIKKGLRIERASKNELTAHLDAFGRPIPLARYGARPVKQRGGGVSVNVLRGRKLIRGAFMATMASGHRGVYVRVGSAAHAALIGSARRHGITARRSVKHGLPIDELFGPAIPSAFLKDVVQQQLETTVRERFPVVLRQELNFAALRA